MRCRTPQCLLQIATGPHCLVLPANIATSHALCPSLYFPQLVTTIAVEKLCRHMRTHRLSGLAASGFYEPGWNAGLTLLFGQFGFEKLQSILESGTAI